MPRKKISYKSSGVDIDAQDRALKEIKKLAKRTFNDDVVSDIGLFGGLYRGGGSRILVASADGVGTKIKLASATGVYDTVGQDLVNHCVNDILAQGAEPMFFLDYFAAGKLRPERLVDVVKGLSKACRENGCALIGGETAEMPGVYGDDDFDLAGFIVGSVDRKNLLPRRVGAGDALIGLPSTGLHTNGYSLARRLFFEELGIPLDGFVKELGQTVSEALMSIHRSYLKCVRPLLGDGGLHALAHITGGGITDNLPRVLPEGVSAEVRTDSWKVPPLFEFIRREGRIDESEMFRVFNMGVGMILIVDAKSSGRIVSSLKRAKEKPFLIGHLVKGQRKVTYK